MISRLPLRDRLPAHQASGSPLARDEQVENTLALSILLRRPTRICRPPNLLASLPAPMVNSLERATQMVLATGKT
jgi:hypothetical protein